MGHTFAFATMFSAVAFTSWYGGWGPAALVAIVGYFVCDAVFHVGILAGGLNEQEAVALVVYLASCASVIALGEATRHARRRLEEAAQDLSTDNLRLERKVND